MELTPYTFAADLVPLCTLLLLAALSLLAAFTTAPMTLGLRPPTAHARLGLALFALVCVHLVAVLVTR